MFKPKSHGMLLVLVVAAVIVAAGGLATASNTGFKINKGLVPSTDTSQKGNNWLSIPYFNPYGNFGAFCTATGLISAGLTRASGVVVNPTTGALSSPVNCGTPGATALTLTPGLGIRVRNAGTGAPTSIIIVGSHNPSLALTIPPAPGASCPACGNFWFAVPYHTTAVTGQDLCNSIGLTQSGLNRGSLQRFDPVAGAPTSPVNCGTTGASAFPLNLGEAIRLRNPTQVTFVPAHF